MISVFCHELCAVCTPALRFSDMAWHAESPGKSEIFPDQVLQCPATASVQRVSARKARYPAWNVMAHGTELLSASRKYGLPILGLNPLPCRKATIRVSSMLKTGSAKPYAYPATQIYRSRLSVQGLNLHACMRETRPASRGRAWPDCGTNTPSKC